MARMGAAVGLALLLTGGCRPDHEDAAETSSAAQAFVHLGTFNLPSGQRLTVSQIALVDVSVTHIASCSQTLFLAKSDGSLSSSVNGGTGPFTDIGKRAPSDKIACDRLHLYALTGTKVLHAATDMDGTLSGPGDWTEVGSVPSPGITEIASGNGNIYAIAPTTATGGSGVWTSQLKEAISASDHVQGKSWLTQATILGDRVSGSGSRAWFNSFSDPGGPYHTKRNRAFAARSDDTLSFNDFYLEQLGGWTQLPKVAGVDILQISAEDSNTLYALATLDGTNKRIIRYAFVETNCRDGLDNDANGLKDAEDPTCRGQLANEWCATRSSGSFCIDRLQNTDGYSHALVTCRPNGEQATLEAGLCVKGTPTAGGSDFLAPPPTINEADTGGRYCSVIHADGSWDVAWGNNKSDPCTGILRTNSYIARAGQFSTVGVNSAQVNCVDRSFVAREAVGTAPLTEAKNAVRAGNRCVLTASPKSMGVFMAPFPKITWSDTYGRGYSTGHFFDHGRRCKAVSFDCPCSSTSASPDCPIDLAPFGNGQTGTSSYIDNRGKGLSAVDAPVDQLSYDFVMAEGVPLKSLGYGTVVESRDFPLYPLSYDYATVGRDTAGTPFMGEIYIRYDIGKDTRYQESYLAYYTHVGLRTVVKGQTVAANQRIGFVGMTGQASGPHLHFAIYRLTNINAQRAGFQGEAAGYKFPFTITNNGMGYSNESLAGAVDPYGWRAPIDGTAASQDPAAHYWKDAEVDNGVFGMGAWSPNLWYGDQEPPFPK